MIYKWSVVKKLFAVLSTVVLVSCSGSELSEAPSPDVVGGRTAYLTDSDDPGLRVVVDKLRKSRSTRTHIVVMGDSHIAADFFTGELRRQFQHRYGDGGVGFISPLRISGNRYSNVRFGKARGWKLFYSRAGEKQDFPFGGSIAVPLRRDSHAHIMLPDHRPAIARVLYRASGDAIVQLQKQTLRAENTEGHWRFSEPVRVPSSFSFAINGDDRSHLAVAGLWLTSGNPGGVIVSVLGINGAQISAPDRWENNWPDTLAQLRPDMVVLAYGTNEAFSADLSLPQYRRTLVRQIRKIRQSNPDVAILLIGPGSSIMHKDAVVCEQRQPALLKKIIRVQKDVARSEHTLFWDWFAWMGGDCSVDQLVLNGKAGRDRIHLTPEGYRDSALALWNEFRTFVHRK